MFDINKYKYVHQIFRDYRSWGWNKRRAILYCNQALKFLNLEIPDYEDYADANHYKFGFVSGLNRTNLTRAATDILMFDIPGTLLRFNLEFGKRVRGRKIRVGMPINKWLMNLYWKVYPRPDFLLQGSAYELFLSWKQLANMPYWAWPNGLVSKMAQQIYDSKNFHEIPIMADAMEDAGCIDQWFLHILRNETMFRGHWLLDLILGIGYKEQYVLPTHEVIPDNSQIDITY